MSETLPPQEESALEKPKPLEKPVRTRVRISKLEKMDCWPEVYAMLEAGDSINEIAQYIQGNREEYTDVQPGSLCRIIYLWMARNPAMTANRLPTVAIHLSSSATHIDPLDGLNMILAIQVDRIASLYNLEKRSGTYNAKTREELKLANEILRTMAEAESKKKRYTPQVPTGGVSPIINQLEQLRAVYTNKYGQAIARVVLSDESRRRVLNALEHVRKGDSEALNRILDRNAKKAEELEEAERQRAKDEANTIDVAGAE